jgi:hypothetical protein
VRLLLRANAHRPVATGNGHTAVEVAASPDTPGRSEPWLWNIRLLDGAPAGRPDDDPARVSLPLGPDVATLEVTVDAGAVRPEVVLVELTDSRLVDRDERELMALLVASGRCLVEGRHQLQHRDTMVLEGDDPLEISIAPVGGQPSSVAIVRLQGTGARTLGWVP